MTRFYRTYQELKLTETLSGKYSAAGFYRTYQELKLVDALRKAGGNHVFIVPIRN